MKIDVNRMRNNESELYGIPLCNDEMTFYYDETGNCGKFSLTENGVNNDNALECDFILGGVAYDGKICSADTHDLLQKLKLQSNKELKFRHINRGRLPFWEFMKNDRVTTYIEWLYNSGLYIHYATMNNLYYGLVDMADSLWEIYPGIISNMEWARCLKSSLCDFCRMHIKEVLPLLYKYHFPNIAREDTREFCFELCELIQLLNDTTTENGFGMEILRQMLKGISNHRELLLLHDNTDNVLVNEYYTVYLNRCYIYKNAQHYFDKEKVIQKNFSNIILIDNGVPVKNYAFIESTKNELIQVER